MLGVRRNQGGAHGNEIDDRGCGIEEGIDQGRQQADRIRQQEGDQLDGDQGGRHADGGVGRQAHQAARAFAQDFGLVHG